MRLRVAHNAFSIGNGEAVLLFSSNHKVILMDANAHTESFTIQAASHSVIV